MIKKATVFGSLFLIALTGLVAFFTLRPQASVPIEEVLTHNLSMPKHEEKYPNKQMRSGVTKDLWIVDHDCGRLHHHIEAPRSILTAVPQGTRVELTEQMLEMTCTFQEKLSQDNGEWAQQIRTLHSSEGTYHYTDQHFDAHQVFLSLYRLPGNDLPTHFNPEAAFLKGVAQEVSLSFSDSSPHFQAQKFKAQIKPEELR